MKYTIEKKNGKNIEGEAKNYKAFVEMNKHDLSYANLSDANLSDANLSDANLSGAKLSYANLSGANLSYADLSCADLSCAKLSCAKLSHANLSHADLDYATIFTLRCTSFGATLDKKQMAQQAYHFCKHKCDAAEVRAAQLALMPLANQFHRVQECGELTAEMFESEGK